MTTAPDPLHAVHAASAATSLERELEEARRRVKDAREAQKRAEAEVAERGKVAREQARANDRRAMMVGRVVLTLAAHNRELWDFVQPLVVKSLADAADTDRALFGMSPAAVRVGDDVEASTSAEAAGAGASARG